MKKLFCCFVLLLTMALLFSACGASGTTGGAGTPDQSRTASFTKIENEVQARATAQDEFAQASVGQQLIVGGEARSGDDGRARLEIQTEGTLIYLSPNTLFTLTALQETGQEPFIRLKLEIGQLWIVLNGGSLEVETPTGTAAVRGSFMGVNMDENGFATTTCLEGDCSMTNSGGTSSMTDGQACDTTSEDQTCQTRDMTNEENQEWQDNVPEANQLTPTNTPPETPTLTPTATFTSTPQSTQGSAAVGPDPDDFPAGFNPLTGQLVGDPDLLNLPAILISITNFPPSARPQAGLSFAPMIFEIYISEGMTRFLVAFYGEAPAVEDPIQGDCAVQDEPFEATDIVVGNLVWLDENFNGIQDPEEPGVGGVCVTLYDTAGNILQTTSTDSNGYYGFNVSAGNYMIGFDQTSSLAFTTPDVGFDDLDSNTDPLTGLTPNFNVTATDMNWDAGLMKTPPTPTPTGTYESPTPEQPGGGGGGGGDVGGPPAVGPIRSMRWPYVYIRNFFTGSCLVSASGDPTVLAHTPGCRYAYGSDENDINSAFLDVTKMRQLAEAQKAKNPSQVLNYSGNVFSEQPPSGGMNAQELRVFYSFLNQTLWKFDPLSGANMRFDDNADGSGIFHPSADRLTGRQLLFDNVIVLFAEHTALAPTIIDINLQSGNFGPAYLFRDGKIFRIYWSTINGEYEQATGLQRPIRFVDVNGNPFPLKPGHTWINVMTTASYVTEEDPGKWLARFLAPVGAK